MSESGGKLPGIDALQSPNLSAWSARLEAAQSAREQAQVEKAAASLRSGKAPQGKEAEQIRQVSREFESLFLAYMMKTMKAAGPKSGFLGDSQGEKIFTEMKDEELAKGMAQAGGIGLARLLEQQLLQSLRSAAGPRNEERQALPLKDARGAIPLSPETKGLSGDVRG